MRANPFEPHDVFKLAMVQMRVEPGKPEINLSRAEALVHRAALAGASLVVLPEALPFGWTDISAQEGAEPVPTGAAFQGVCALARHHSIFICTGWIERDHAQLYNAAILIGRDGEMLLRHRKINELPLAHSLYSPGTSLKVVATQLATIGLMVCSDAFVPGQIISRTLAQLGAQIILSPCAWAVPADHDPIRNPYGALWLKSYTPVARTFQIWIVGVSNVGPIATGPWRGRNCIGCSLAVGPDGTPRFASYGADAEEIVYVDIELPPRPSMINGWPPQAGTGDTD